MAKPIAVVTKAGTLVAYKELSQYVTKTAESRQLKDPFAGLYTAGGLVQPIYNPAMLVRLLDYNTYHARCCRTKARDVAGYDWHLIPLGNIEEPNEEQRQVLDDFFSGLSLPLNELLYRMMLDYYAVGWGALELVREEYDPKKPYVNMYHHPAFTLRVHRAQDRWCQIVGGQKVWYATPGATRLVNKDTGDFMDSLPENKRASELLVNMAYSPRTQFYGVPDFVPAIGAIHGDLSRVSFNNAFFQHYGVPAFAVIVSGDYDEGKEDEATGLTELETVIQEHMREIVANPYSTLFLSIPSRVGGGSVNVQLIPLSVDVKEASFRLFRRDNRDEVLHAHGVPGYRIGVVETGSLGGSTAEESTEIYFDSVIKPARGILEFLLNTHIVWNGFQAMDWKIKLVGGGQRNDMRDLDMMLKLEEAGAIRPIEIARRFADQFGLDPDETNPALHLYYLKGQPLGAEMMPDEIQTMVKAYLAGRDGRRRS